ncbi:hypothetical protein JTB14_009266 [Gonioctena quinquepunctata]|nr:hypothetical protein JTB14_009266 [Gonioctena quinquepunctata]
MREVWNLGEEKWGAERLRLRMMQLRIGIIELLNSMPQLPGQRTKVPINMDKEEEELDNVGVVLEDLFSSSGSESP